MWGVENGTTLPHSLADTRCVILPHALTLSFPFVLLTRTASFAQSHCAVNTASFALAREKMAGLACEQSFFQGSLGRGRAETLLAQATDDGTFIVRTSSSGPGNYVLSICAQRNVLHFQIKNQGEVCGCV